MTVTEVNSLLGRRSELYKFLHHGEALLEVEGAATWALEAAWHPEPGLPYPRHVLIALDDDLALLQEHTDRYDAIVIGAGTPALDVVLVHCAGLLTDRGSLGVAAPGDPYQLAALGELTGLTRIFIQPWSVGEGAYLLLRKDT